MKRTEIQTQQNRFFLFLGFFAGPVVWALQLFIGYALVPVACRSGSKLALYLVSGVAAVIILFAELLSLLKVKANMRSQDFLMISGMLLSSLFFLLAVYTGVGQIFFNSACPVNTIPFP